MDAALAGATGCAGEDEQAFGWEHAFGPRSRADTRTVGRRHVISDTHASAAPCCLASRHLVRRCTRLRKPRNQLGRVLRSRILSTQLQRRCTYFKDEELPPRQVVRCQILDDFVGGAVRIVDARNKGIDERLDLRRAISPRLLGARL